MVDTSGIKCFVIPPALNSPRAENELKLLTVPVELILVFLLLTQQHAKKQLVSFHNLEFSLFCIGNHTVSSSIWN